MCDDSARDDDDTTMALPLLRSSTVPLGALESLCVCLIIVWLARQQEGERIQERIDFHSQYSWPGDCQVLNRRALPQSQSANEVMLPDVAYSFTSPISAVNAVGLT